MDNIDKVVKAAEKDAGQPIAGLSDALNELKNGDYKIHTPTDIVTNKRAEK